MQRPPTNRFFAYALILTLVGSLFSIVLPAFQPSYASHENITVNIGLDDVTDSYDPGDDVAIEGVIDEEVDGEDVFIRIYETDSLAPEETENFGEPGSGGVFDHLYSIPNNAEEGVWTVEVEYDGEEAFTYFMVDEEDDTIFVVLEEDSGIFEAGDEVTVLGEVDDVDLDEAEFVEIIVLDPANDEIINEDEVELDGLDFEFSFDLENDASHGRYAILITYDFDDQAGTVLFEIEDDDTGSDDDDVSGGGVTEDTDGDLSAEIPDDVYEQGDTVLITGGIEDYDVDDNEELDISIRDPDGLEIEADDDVTVDEDVSGGVFEFEYDIDDDADEGDYTITITYNNDEVELSFEVEEAAGSDDDDDSSATSGDLTASLDEPTYLAGEIMTVTGTVDELEEDEEGDPERASIILYRPNGQVIIAASKHVEPSDDGDFSAAIVLDTDFDLEEEDGYRVTVSYHNDDVNLFFDITGVSDTPGNEITVETDEDEYSIGQTVEISGEVPDVLLADGDRMVIRINKPDGNPCRIDQISVPSSGSYDYEMVLGGTCGVAGEYEVEVTYSGEGGKTSFELIGSSASEYNLEVEGDTYPIEYELSGGSINNMFVRPTEDKLVITLNAEEAGQLTVVLPREVIDAVEDGDDVAYIVTIENESGEITTIAIEESENTDDARTLVIDYEAGTGRIEITGTQVVPEFGAIAAIVMAVAIVGIIIATARHNNKFSLFGQ